MTTATLAPPAPSRWLPSPTCWPPSRAGQPVLVLDDADRENEADLIVAADRISPPPWRC